jgi:hypothetical protein
VAALERAFAEVLGRHAAWRTVVRTVDGQPCQVVLPPAAPTLPLVDLTHLAPDLREAAAVELAQRDAREPFDLERGPLWRATLVFLGEAGYRLHLTLQHLIFDGVSIYRVLLPELRALHDAFANCLPSPLPELPVQYADYARWQHGRAARRSPASSPSGASAWPGCRRWTCRPTGPGRRRRRSGAPAGPSRSPASWPGG